MTDITELAQSLKAAAEKAQIEEGLTWFSEDQLSHEDGIALHKADAEFIAMANPANILALVEALEKAQAQSSKWLEAYHKAVSIGARYEERIA
ncbi:ead/Ea22-like family protein, partial [Klebsiella pneumoniae]|uniref:ead/Ea22-like family protein n=1 Tax=Klebsiella pneumoniae TaxID=573 RepID=UPI00391A9237